MEKVRKLPKKLSQRASWPKPERPARVDTAELSRRDLKSVDINRPAVSCHTKRERIIFNTKLQQSGTLAQTWARVGIGTTVKSDPVRKSIKVLGAINVSHAERPRWHDRFDEVFNTQTYLRFLKQLVRYYPRQKSF